MKTQHVARNVTISAQESAAFTTTQSAKIIRMLIDGLYADKAQSIFREMWSNALDSHVQAGCADRPFDVTFPSRFDPTFRVRDYGVSLTHDQVMNMYTSLGTSTKEDTNDAIGKFGIGSKAPFAYTDNFTVTAYLDGEARYYSAMIGEDGVPAIHLLGSSETDEENGLEVSFPVEDGDVQDFRRAANRVSMGFDVKPNVVNDISFKGWPEIECIMQRDGWRVVQGQISGAHARMGPVLYPIDKNSLGPLDYKTEAVLTADIIIDFPMGDLEVTASRESLSYGRNDPTKASILARLEDIVGEVVEEIESSIKDQPSYWDACVQFRTLVTGGLPNDLQRFARNSGVQYKGRDLKTDIRLERTFGARRCVLNGWKLRNQSLRFSENHGSDIPAQEKTTFIFEDESIKNPRASARIKHYQNTNPQKTIVWFKIHNLKKFSRWIYANMDLFGGVEFIDVTEIELPPAATPTYTRGPRRPVQARWYNGHGFERVTLSNEEQEEGGYIVPMMRGEPEIKNGIVSIEKIVNLLHKMGEIDRAKVFFIPKTIRKQFDGDQWIDLYDDIPKIADRLLDGFEEMVSHHSACQAVREIDIFEMLSDNLDRARLGGGVALTACNLMDEASIPMDVEHMRRLRQLADELRRDYEFTPAEEHPLVIRAREVEGAIPEAYPMLAVMEPRILDSRDILVDTLTNYVIMCDTATETDQRQAA